jgi:hypothetical protein
MPYYEMVGLIEWGRINGCGGSSLRGGRINGNIWRCMWEYLDRWWKGIYERISDWRHLKY